MPTPSRDRYPRQLGSPRLRLLRGTREVSTFLRNRQSPMPIVSLLHPSLLCPLLASPFVLVRGPNPRLPEDDTAPLPTEATTQASLEVAPQLPVLPSTKAVALASAPSPVPPSPEVEVVSPPSLPSGESSDSLAGKLQKFAPAWVPYAPSRWLRILKRGYHWTWKSKPPKLSMPKLLMQSRTLQDEVQSLLEKGAIYPVSPEPCFLADVSPSRR